MIKVLFLIHDLSVGGAEKVLVNLANNMDSQKFDVTVYSLFDIGINRQFLKPHIHYKYWMKKVIPGNSHLMKLLSPQKLHRLIIKEHYDIEVAYLEGPCARVISGSTDSNAKLVSWIHIEQHTPEDAARSFCSIAEARVCYGNFDRIICVSRTVQEAFKKALSIPVQHEILYNTNESLEIVQRSKEPIEEVLLDKKEVKIVGVGKLVTNKGFDRILRIVHKLLEEGNRVHLYILGVGPEKENLIRLSRELQIEEKVTFLGYQTNPYKYVSKCDLFVCASYAEGFSTAATEALIVGTPVCTVEVSGMKEMLGENNEYGIVTRNEDEALYEGIKSLLDNPEKLSYYRQQAKIRGKCFSTEETVKEVENMLLSL